MAHSPDRSTPPAARKGAKRLQAYRQRLAEGDLVRTEILLPTSVRDVIRDVAEAEGSRYLETVSALAQFGLEAYQAERGAQALCSLSAGLATRAIGDASTVGAVPMTADVAIAAGAHADRGLGPFTAPNAAFAAPPNAAFAAAIRSALVAAGTPTPSLVTTPGGRSPLARFLHSRKDASHDTP